jgi:hypothetical protein
MARLTRRLSADVPDFAATIDRLRSTFAGQVAQHFAPELAALDEPSRARRIAVVAALTSFETWDQLATVDDRPAALAAALRDLLRADPVA